MEQRRVSILIRGKVQGVFFRQSAFEQARRLGLKGWVRNLASGEVEALAEGTADSVERFVRWCHTGPPSARVTQVQVADAPPGPALPGFQVERTEG